MKFIKIAVPALVGILSVASAFAQNVSVTKTGPAVYESKNKTVTISPQATTIYTQPGKGPTGEPIPGNQAGSSSKTSYGAALTIRTDIFGK